LTVKYESTPQIDAWLKSKGVILLGYGKRENRTDGECHRIYGKIQTFELWGNYYDRKLYDKLIEWAQKNKIRVAGDDLMSGAEIDNS